MIEHCAWFRFRQLEEEALAAPWFEPDETCRPWPARWGWMERQ